MNQSLYNRMSQAKSGQVQILGDPALLVDLPEHFVKYAEKGYNTAEEINLGLGGRFEIPAAPSATTTSFLDIPAPNTSLPYMTQRVTIPSNVALWFLVASAKIAATELIDGEPICADVFSEVSLNNGVRWPTAQTGQQIQLNLGNTDPAAAHEPRISLTGIRLR